MTDVRKIRTVDDGFRLVDIRCGGVARSEMLAEVASCDALQKSEAHELRADHCASQADVEIVLRDLNSTDCGDDGPRDTSSPSEIQPAR